MQGNEARKNSEYNELSNERKEEKKKKTFWSRREVGIRRDSERKNEGVQTQGILAVL